MRKKLDISNVTENNVMVIAAVFSPFVNTSYANPPKKNEFVTHYIDAVAAAKPRETGSNIVKENFTHTVLVEEATAQYCPYCPAMADALNNISKSIDHKSTRVQSDNLELLFQELH
jgi:thiol-disulfide isomerase/thioredoxin